MVGGFITTNTHWQLADSPFIASSSILVDNGATLSIDPGVEVRFASSTSLVVVNGMLSARGSIQLPIKFTADQIGDVNRWNGLRFGSNTVDAVFDGGGAYLSGSIIEHATVEAIARQDNGSISIESSAPFIHSSTIHGNLSTGIVASNVDGLRIVGNQIHHNDYRRTGGGGVTILSSHGVHLAGNEITDNYAAIRGGGIYIADGSNNVIKDNTIARNFGHEWGAGLDSDNEDDLTIVGNIISDNEGQLSRSSGVDIKFGDNISLMNNIIVGNNSGAGLAIESCSGVSLAGNEIVGNVGDGILFREYVTNAIISADASNPTVIRGNGGFQVFNNQLFEVTTNPLARGNVDARNVWWGTTNIPTIQAGIYDFFDNSLKGIVFFDPIALSESPTGDYNHNGFVDAADYIIWRDTLGSTTNLTADGNGNSQIDAGDYTVWRAHFGQTAGSGTSVFAQSPSSASANVPEPSWLVLALFAASLALFRRTSQ